MSELWIQKVEREAAEMIAALVSHPLSERDDMQDVADFDPWEPFQVYGNYGGEFDRCAIDVLTELISGSKKRDDLGAEMFREMLCNLHLCTYGTSPRVCFPTTPFAKILPAFLQKWKEYSLMHWGEQVWKDFPSALHSQLVASLAAEEK